MFQFTKKAELFAIESRISKNGNPYTIITLLADNGKTVDVVFSGQSIDYAKLVARESYDFTFQLELGKYTRLTITSIGY